MTPIHWAVRLRDVELVQILIRYNSDLNEMDDAGRTALYFAIENGDTVLTKVLICIIPLYLILKEK